MFLGEVVKLVFANTPRHTYPPHLLDEPDFQRPLPVYNKGLKYLQKKQAFSYKPQTSVPPSLPMVSPCMMFSSSSSSYQTHFPTLRKQTDPSTKVSSQPYIQSPVTPAGQLEEPRPFEAVQKPINKSLSGSSEPIIFDHMTQFGKICTPMGALVIRLV